MPLKLTRLALIFAAALTLPHVYAAEAHTDTAADEIAGMMMDPALWQALGSVKPGTVAGITHDVNRNSAFIAEALMRKHGVHPPYEKLTDDPALALSKFREYGKRALADDNFMPSAQSCGIAVAHAYGSTFAYMLQSIEPSLVQFGINAADTRQMLDDARLAARGDMKTLRVLCDDRQFDALNAAFRSFMGEMYVGLMQMAPTLLTADILPDYTEDLATALNSDLVSKLRAGSKAASSQGPVLMTPAAVPSPAEDRSPAGLRRSYREQTEGSTDMMDRAARSFDDMVTYQHPACDSLVNHAYLVASNRASPPDFKVRIITENLLDQALRAGCIRQ